MLHTSPFFNTPFRFILKEKNLNLKSLTLNPMLTTIVGNYPKITEDKNQANLRLALNKFDQKKITFEELEKTYEQTFRR
jgi:thioredoxin reductase